MKRTESKEEHNDFKNAVKGHRIRFTFLNAYFSDTNLWGQPT